MKRSAGILLYRRAPELQVLLGHSGGPLFTSRSAGAWSIPKGEYLPDEAPLAAARREFTEELGLPVPDGPLVELGEITQRSGKLVTAWAIEADLDPSTITPGTFSMQWPPRSGLMKDFPEIDRVQWLPMDQARPLLIAGQQEFLDRLVGLIS